MQEQEFLNTLDELRHNRTPAPDYLASRIIANVSDPAPLDKFLDWLRASFWRGAMTALLPLALGFAAGNFNDETDINPWVEADALVYASTLTEYEYDEI